MPLVIGWLRHGRGRRRLHNRILPAQGLLLEYGNHMLHTLPHLLPRGQGTLACGLHHAQWQHTQGTQPHMTAGTALHKYRNLLYSNVERHQGR